MLVVACGGAGRGVVVVVVMVGVVVIVAGVIMYIPSENFDGKIRS